MVVNERCSRCCTATWILAAGVGALLSACAHDQIPLSTPVASQAEAGTVLVAPTMVASWDDVSAALKPNFALTGDQAAAQVLPTTESISEQVLDAFGASLAVGLPTTTKTYSNKVGGTSPGVSTDVEKNPGTAPTLVSALPSATQPVATGTTPTLGLDPVLKYKAANNLLQEVQLLNQEIDNAANRSCYVPYVVKLKLAVMNYRPRLPYSVHAHLSFLYNGAFGTENSAIVGSSGIPPEPTFDLANECRFGKANPAVIPFLVADDLDVALRSRAAEAASQIAVGLSGMVSGAGIGANINAARQSLTAITNQELTSAVTVGRESENSLYVLITPNNEASNQASLVSQTYDVAVLLLVPRSYFGHVDDPKPPFIALSTFTEYRDAKTGIVLGNPTQDVMADEADRLFKRHLTAWGRSTWDRLTPREKAAEARRLAFIQKSGNADIFFQSLECHQIDGLDPSALCVAANDKPPFDSRTEKFFWADVSSLLDYDAEKFSLFQVPLPAPIKVPSQAVLLNDDGQHPIQAVLGGVSARTAAKLAAFLDITPFDPKTKKGQSELSIPAQAIALDTTAHTLTLTFPSLKKLGVSCLSPPSDPPKAAATPATKTVDETQIKGAKVTNTVTTIVTTSAGVPVSKHKTVKSKPDDSFPPDKTDAACPMRSASDGTSSRPNTILLQLVNCDPTKQVCPVLTRTLKDSSDWSSAVTDRVTALTSAAQFRADDAQTRADDLSKQLGAAKADDGIKQAMWRSGTGGLGMASVSESATSVARTLLVEQEDALTAVDNFKKQKAALASVSTDIEAVDAATAAVNAAAAKVEKAAARQLASAQSALDTARKTLLDAKHKLAADAKTAGALDAIRDYALLGVALTSTSTSTTPPKVTLANQSGAVTILAGGQGQLTVALTPSPATDTVGVSVTGAELRSVTDATGALIPFTAKHGYVLSTAGVYTHNLAGLNPEIPVVLSAQALNGDTADGDPKIQVYQPNYDKAARLRRPEAID